MNQQEPDFVAATDIFAGDVVITVPHMDDAVLGCGGTLLQIEDKRRIHVVYCTHGACPDFDRAQEARDALQAIGILERNIVFLDFPDWHLGEHAAALREALSKLVDDIRPSQILTPFRYDRHPDHIALGSAVRALAAEGGSRIEVIEYFVYFTWRLLPGSDVRRHIDSRHIVRVDTSKQALRKREIVAFFKSQTEAPAPGQLRPALTAEYLDVLCADREYFVRNAQSVPDRDLFTTPFCLIHLVHRLEPSLKVLKEKIRTLLMR